MIPANLQVPLGEWPPRHPGHLRHRHPASPVLEEHPRQLLRDRVGVGGVGVVGVGGGRAGAGHDEGRLGKGVPKRTLGRALPGGAWIGPKPQLIDQEEDPTISCPSHAAPGPRTQVTGPQWVSFGAFGERSLPISASASFSFWVLAKAESRTAPSPESPRPIPPIHMPRPRLSPPRKRALPSQQLSREKKQERGK